MKVLILSHSSELAGAELSMLDLFDYWVGKGWVEPHFIIRRPLRSMSKALRLKKWSYTPMYYTNWSQRTLSRKAEDVYRNSLFNTKTVFKIEKLIQELKPDVVMTNTIVSPWAALAAHYQGVPHIWFVREYGDADHKHIFEVGRDKMLEDIGTLSNLVVTNSKTLAKDISAQIDSQKITALYTPFDLEKLKQRGAEKQISPFKDKDSLKLVITGRIAPSKGQPETARAVGELTKLGHNVELCIVGEPSETEDITELNDVIKKYKIANKVHLVGSQPNPLKFVALADVGITASYKEAFGRVTFEYMSIGKPVVGADSGATPEMIDSGKNGYLYERGNYESLTKQLLNYVNNRQLIAEHGLAAERKTVKMMAGPNNADALYERVKQAVADKSSMTKPLNYSHRWLEYPSVAKQYIHDSGVISLKKLLYQRLRHRAKIIYLAFARVFGLKPGK